jgi:acetyl-CoA C-acetyltransferase
MPEALIIDACRTPRGIGKVDKGALAHLHPQQLGAAVLRAIAARNHLDTKEVDDVIWGTSTQVDKQGADLGRMAALDAGYDIVSSGVTLDRFCGSGITAVSMATAAVMSGMEDLIVAGGTEMMSYTANLPQRAPFMDRGNEHLRSHTKVSAPTPSRRCKESAAPTSMPLRWKANSAPAVPSRAVSSIAV